MASNTLSADVNEILLGYYLLDGKWTAYHESTYVRSQLGKRQKQLSEEEYFIREQQAKVMAEEIKKWSSKNGFSGFIQKVWWTARPGDLSKAIGYKVDSRKNPTDVLIRFSTGEFLGVSAKSTKTPGDIGFKNPGIGTIEKDLGINLANRINRSTKRFIDKWSLSDVTRVRRNEIRDNPKIKEDADKERTALLKNLSNFILKTLNNKPKKWAKEYILEKWLDAGDEVRPFYIKVTGFGEKNITANIMSPLEDSKAALLQSRKRLSFTKVGNDAIGVMVANKRILKMRLKFESIAMASSIKASGEPWK